MPLTQQDSGVFSGASFTASLPMASMAVNCVVLIVAGNTAVTTPSGWRTSATVNQFNQMGHYLFDLQGVSLQSVTVATAGGQGTWWIGEVAGGSYQSGAGGNAVSSGITAVTPNLTPAMGSPLLIASIASLSATPRTVSGWTNGFIEQADVCQAAAADAPMQGVAILEAATLGLTTYNTTVSYSAASTGRSSMIAAYATSTTPGAVWLAPNRRIGKRR